MKKLIPFAVLVVLFFMFSCNRENIKPENRTMEQLSVDDNFDWQTAANINFNISKSTSGVI